MVLPGVVSTRRTVRRDRAGADSLGIRRKGTPPTDCSVGLTRHPNGRCHPHSQENGSADRHQAGTLVPTERILGAYGTMVPCYGEQAFRQLCRAGSHRPSALERIQSTLDTRRQAGTIVPTARTLGYTGQWSRATGRFPPAVCTADGVHYMALATAAFSMRPSFSRTMRWACAATASS